MTDDWRREWFRRRRWPFFGSRIFRDVDEVFREMEELMQRGFREFTKRTPRDLIRERTLPNGSKVREWGPFVYGYSMTIGPDGKPQVREFGNVKPRTRLGRARINIREQREPLVDILETDSEVRIIAELPGVEKKDIQLHGKETSLTITVDTSQRKYFKEVELPAKIDLKQAKSTYKNGVLEITVPKKKQEKPRGEPIQIE